ncbi:transglutaminase-like domain-containing protein [Balneola vulgaris]|jgi:regulator of sirC expression with transglutaminase-like and TPR domain|uniref:transglutaminase-like domain-containing protein n=1 Tax=Balneola vulgaris TaxID=287535 RepID=UPI00035FF9F3|nr:transglutaminase-like domain-containing protein [Balneola vulgaris]
MIKKKEIESLLYLMDDPDPFVQESVQQRFVELGESAVPLLDEYRVDLKQPAQKEKVSDLIHTLTFEGLQADFVLQLEQGIKNRKDLEDILFILARFGNPTLRTASYKERLDHFAEMVAPSIRYKLDERKKAKQLFKFVFEDLNFRGDTETYHNPANCFLDQVIERRVGLPISLSQIAMFIARRLDLPVFGVNMPIHFMLTFIGDKEEFLVDPYDKGAVVSYDQCYFFLKKNNIEPRPDFFQMASDMDILIRTIRNLIHSYERQEQLHKVEDLKALLSTAELFE